MLHLLSKYIDTNIICQIMQILKRFHTFYSVQLLLFIYVIIDI